MNVLDSEGVPAVNIGIFTTLTLRQVNAENPREMAQSL